MPEYRKMSKAEIEAARKRLQELTGQKKELPKGISHERAEQIKREIGQCRAMITHAIKFNNQPLKREMMENIEKLKRELGNNAR